MLFDRTCDSVDPHLIFKVFFLVVGPVFGPKIGHLGGSDSDMQEIGTTPYPGAGFWRSAFGVWWSHQLTGGPPINRSTGLQAKPAS